MWGTESDVLSETQAQRMIATLPNATLAAIPGVGHVPSLNEPESIEALDRHFASARSLTGSST
jgi:pimeloyl-ACP methyl ester carboxylesterase